MTDEAEVDVSRCPECDEKGTYDGRVLLGGRGVWKCPNRHMWQNINEKPTRKGVPIDPSWRRGDGTKRLP